MPDSILPNLALFLLAAMTILFAGTRLVHICDELADRTGWGEAIFGAFFLGGLTSLPGITASVTAAWSGAASLALSNAYGGIAAQTLFIAVADIVYREANLEHAAASLENMLASVGLLILLALLLFAHATPTLAIGHVHPISILLPFVYFAMLVLINRSRAYPMWFARVTQQTKSDRPLPDNQRMSKRQMLQRWLALIVIGMTVVAAGWLLTQSGMKISKITGVSESLIGALLIAIITSLPELVTTVVAVKQGALTLAVGGVLGGNAFDTLFAAVADCAYVEGSIYGFVKPLDEGFAALSAVMTGTLLLGLLLRQQRGPGGIGFESIAILTIYTVGFSILFLS